VFGFMLTIFVQQKGIFSIGDLCVYNLVQRWLKWVVLVGYQNDSNNLRGFLRFMLQLGAVGSHG
jgi:hypothetical protein